MSKYDWDKPIGIAGGGRVGQALGRLLRKRGEPVVAVSCRRLDHAEAAAAFVGPGVHAVPYPQLPTLALRVLVTVPDDSLGEVAQMLARSGMDRGMALHTCGAHGPEALSPLMNQGVSCAVLHPLQTIPSPASGVTALTGISFAIAGGGPAASWAERIVQQLEGKALHIPPDCRPLYHAAAVMASNYLVALVDAAATLMRRSGVQPSDAVSAIAPLVEASARNALRMGPERALTGPIQRGDLETVVAHLEALGSVSPGLRELYSAAARWTLDVAFRCGLESEKFSMFDKLLRENEK